MADINTNLAAGSCFSFRDRSHDPIVVNGLDKMTRFHRGGRLKSPTATCAATAAISPAAGEAATAAAPPSVRKPATVATTAAANKPDPAGTRSPSAAVKSSAPQVPQKCQPDEAKVDQDKDSFNNTVCGNRVLFTGFADSFAGAFVLALRCSNHGIDRRRQPAIKIARLKPGS